MLNTKTAQGKVAPNITAKKEDKNNNNVKVVVRCRPLNEDEKKKQCASVIQCESSRKEVAVQIDDEKLATYYFDRVFDHTASQEFVYRSTIADSVEDAIQGYNCTIFAYGQTGTGKTYTMEGKRNKCKDKTSPFWYGDHAGMIPRASQHIFQRLIACNIPYKISVSYTELYNNEIIDLLADGNVSKLSIRTDEGKKGCIVAGLKQVRVNSPEDIFSILEIAGNKRNVAETLLNARSSRSHCIFTVTIHTKEPSETGEPQKRTGKLNLVDLAGSENTKRSGVVDKRQKEAAMINKSLLSLRRVITALASNESYVPFRDSNLTRLLQESLGGKSKTCMIATISTSEDCLEETKSTLQYAFSAKSIKNAPVLNHKLTKSAQIQEYKEHIQNLQDQLAASRSDDGFYVDQKTYDYHLQLVEKITELQETIQEKDELIIEIQKKCDTQAIQLELSKKEIKRIQIELFQSKESLQEISKKLEISKRNLQEQIDLVVKHQSIEKKLQKQNKEFISLLEDSKFDIQTLHEKSNQRQTIYTNNKITQENILQNIHKYLNSLGEILKNLKDISGTHKISLQSDFSLLSDNFHELQEKISFVTNECYNLLNDQSNNFFTVYKKIQQTRDERFQNSYNHSQEMFNSCQNNLNHYTNEYNLKFDSLSENYEKCSGSLLHSCNELETIFENSSQEINELQMKYNKILNDIQSLSSLFAEEYKNYYNEQTQLLINSKTKYLQSMQESKRKFLQQMEIIYDKHVAEQQKEFEEKLNFFENSLNNSYSQVIEFKNDCDDFCNDLIEQKNSQIENQERNSNLFYEFSSFSTEDINNFTTNRNFIIQQSKTALLDSNQSIEEKWQDFMKQSKQKYSSHVLSLQKLQSTINKTLNDCNNHIDESIENQYSKVFDDVQCAIDKCVLPKQLELSEKKIIEHIQIQNKYSNDLETCVSKISKSFPNSRILSGNTPKKEKQYSFSTCLPSTISHDEIISMRRDGKINVIEDSVDSMDTDENSSAPVVASEQQLVAAETHQNVDNSKELTENISPNLRNTQRQLPPGRKINLPQKRKRTVTTNPGSKIRTAKRRKIAETK